MRMRFTTRLILSHEEAFDKLVQAVSTPVFVGLEVAASGVNQIRCNIDARHVTQCMQRLVGVTQVARWN